MKDEIELAGSQAWHDGKGERDCPYTDTYVRNSGGYWDSPAGLRQRWLHGFRAAWQQNEIIMRNRRWQRAEWTWHD